MMLRTELLLFGIGLFLFLWASSTDLKTWHLRSAYDAFLRGDMNTALSAWKAAGQRPEAVYNRAVIHARKNEVEKSLQLFAQVATADAPDLRQRALYNYGTLLLQKGRGELVGDQEKARRSLSLAETQLKAALLLNPRDGDAIHNAAVVHDSLVEVNALIASKRGDSKKAHVNKESLKFPETAKEGAQKGKQTDMSGKAGAETGNGDAKAKARSATAMDRNGAERLLNAARSRETLRSTTVARTKPSSVTPPEKDW
jgi:hypothetical protein